MEWEQLMSEIRDINKKFDHLQKGEIYIEVDYDEGENWEFVFVEHADKKVMAVF